MGRRKQTQPTIPPSFYREAFHVRQDGALCWRERPRSHFPARLDDVGRFNNQRTGEPAGFRGPNGKPLVRFMYGGKTRRVALLKAAWIVATGELPRGPILPRNGDPTDARPENLIEVRHGRNPFGALTDKHSNGGKASSLDHRAKATTTLINALAANPGSTVPMLSRLVGSSSPCVCVRLSRLADAGLCIGPRCDSRARWDLTARGRELAATPSVVLIDDVDRRVLQIIARFPCRLMKIVRQAGICRLTARRRIDRLVARKLVEAQDGKFRITDEGRKALGNAVPARWVDLDRLRASLARDVQARSPTNDRTAAQIAAHARMARGRPRGGKQALMRAMAV